MGLNHVCGVDGDGGDEREFEEEVRGRGGRVGRGTREKEEELTRKESRRDERRRESCSCSRDGYEAVDIERSVQSRSRASQDEKIGKKESC